jgi:N-acetylglucosaminyldiphosphoundecaprenol N-acetyl-beta-D-mannosaminyltransferase
MAKMEQAEITRFSLLDVPIAATSMSLAIQVVRSWIERGDRGRMVTFSNVHMLVEGIKNPEFAKLLKKSDMNCPDGMPLVWLGRYRVGKSVQRVSGPDFLPAFCAATADMNLRHFFYGGADGVAEKAAAELQRRYPQSLIAGFYAPPFRSLTDEENEEVIRTINAARPDVVWVCLGCPKQEIWIDDIRGKLDVPVLLAVGLAVDILAGTRKRAPRILRNLGLEWFYRLCHEPLRLWKRYLVSNCIFLYRLLIETLAPFGCSDTKV